MQYDQKLKLYLNEIISIDIILTYSFPEFRCISSIYKTTFKNVSQQKNNDESFRGKKKYS